MVILADTSVWIEYLRRTGSSTNKQLRSALRKDDVVVTEPVIMEVLSGARNPRHLRELERLMHTQELLSVGWLEGWHDGAAVYRRCRARGITVRSVIDCLIAAVAIREDVPVLTADRDFAAIASVTELRLA